MNSVEPVDQYEIAILKFINPAIEAIGFIDSLFDIACRKGDEFFRRPLAAYFIESANADNNVLRAATDTAFVSHSAKLSENMRTLQIGRAA